MGSEHSPRSEKSASENFNEVKFLRSYSMFVSYLPREVDEGIIRMFYFKMEIEYEDLRESRS